MEEVFILLSDDSGTTHSSDDPIGFAVRTREEADQFVRDGGWGYSHSFQIIRVMDNYSSSQLKAAYDKYVKNNVIK